MLRIGVKQVANRAAPAMARRSLASLALNSHDTGDGDFRGQDEWRAARAAVLEAIGKNEELRNSMVYSFAMSGTHDHNSKFSRMVSSPTLQMSKQIQNSEGQLLWPKISNKPSYSLPRTLSEATRPHAKEAIVVTEVHRPFRIVNVNKAWEGLCEYTAAESYGKSLRDLLHGEETDPLAITALMSTLMRGEEAGTMLTNYTKSGRKFRNRLRVGPIHDESGKLTHFVGVLQEDVGSQAVSFS